MKKPFLSWIFLGSAIFLLNSVLIVGICSAYSVPESPSAVYNLNLDWKFLKPSGATWPLKSAVDGIVDEQGRYFYEPDYNDSNWDDVSLPHTFNDADSFHSTANDAGDMGVYRGITFYRKIFTLPAADVGKKVFIEFEGIRQAAYVYLNGVMVGYYEAGVTPFGFDLSKHVKFGEKNVLAIAADNTSGRGMTHYISETRPESTPGINDGIGFQWNTKDFNPVMGGLTRNVSLYVKDQVYQTLPLYSNLKTKGVYIYPSDINVAASTLTINVESEVRNESGVKQNVFLEVAVVNHLGELAYKFISPTFSVEAARDLDEEYLTVVTADAYKVKLAPVEVSSRDSMVIQASAQVENIRLWCPDDPYLYQVYSILRDDQGQVLDVNKVTTGFRKVEIRGGVDGGVFINDQYVWLTGYAQRATNEWAAIGIAPDWLRDYDAQLIKESNANYMRWMHIAAQPVDIRAGDKFGIVSVQPAGDKEGDTDGRAWDQRVEVMRDVIIYFRNNPSIFFWEAGNAEISQAHMREMTKLRKELDPYGMRFMGCRTLSNTAAIAESEWVGTMLGRRVRDGGGYTTGGKIIRDMRTIIETEYSREEAPRRVWDDFSPPDFDYVNVFTGSNGTKENNKDAWDLTSEDFVLRNVSGYYEFYSRRMQANSANPYYSGAAALCWSDSSQHGRQQATENARMSGRVDPVRIKKQSFYAFQAIQSQEPAIYLVGHWNYPTDPSTFVYEIKDPVTHLYTGETAIRDAANKTVYVVASDHVSKVELWINGELVGVDNQARDAFLYEFPGIDIMQPGYIEAVGYSLFGGELVRHKIETVDDVVGIRLTPMTGPDGLRADGSDIAFIDVEVVDAYGRVHPLDYERIDFEIQGPAVFLGGYNSGVKDLRHDPTYVYAENGTNRVFIRSTREAGPIKITAKRPGLRPVSVVIESVPFEVDKSGLTRVMPQELSRDVGPKPVLAAALPPWTPLAADFPVQFDKNMRISRGFEHILVENLCETPINGASLLEGAVDGSKYYLTNDVLDLPGLPSDSMDLLVWSMDIRFDQEGAGFTPMGADEKMGTCIRSHTRREKYQLAAQAGSTVYTPYMEIDPQQWYHIELMGKFSSPDSFMYMLVWRYNEKGERTDLQIFSNVNRRNLNANNYQGASFIRVEPNTSIDNVRIFRPEFDQLILSAPTDLVLSGENLPFEVKGFRYGIELAVDGDSAVDYVVYDEKDQHPLSNPDITIDNHGLLRVGQSANEQEINVWVTSLDGAVKDTMKIKVKSSNVFEVVSLGMNEEFNRITDLELVKNFYFNGQAVCVIKVYDEKQNLKDLVTRNIACNLVPIKEPHIIPIDYSLPSDFHQNTWQIKVAIVSSVDY